MKDLLLLSADEADADDSDADDVLMYGLSQAAARPRPGSASHDQG